MTIQFPVNEKLMSPENVYKILKEVLAAEDELDQNKEHFWALGLNAQNQIKYIDLIHLGSVTACPCSPMEVFRRACIIGVVSVVVAHNHPSGSTKPSREDQDATRRLKDAGQILGIRLLDHIIVGDESYYSFADDGSLT